MLAVVIFKEIGQISQIKYSDWNIGCWTSNTSPSDPSGGWRGLRLVFFVASLLSCPFPSIWLADCRGAARFVIGSIEMNHWLNPHVPSVPGGEKENQQLCQSPGRIGPQFYSFSIRQLLSQNQLLSNFCAQYQMDQQGQVLFNQLGTHSSLWSERVDGTSSGARWSLNQSFSFPLVVFLIKFASAKQVTIASDKLDSSDEQVIQFWRDFVSSSFSWERWRKLLTQFDYR